MPCAPTTANWPSCVRRSAISLTADRAEFGWQPAVDCWLAPVGRLLRPAGRRGIHRPDHPHRVRRPRAGPSASLRGHRGTCSPQGAPVAAHWIADRQVAPGLLAYGTDEQRQRLLPRIAAGRFFSAIGMSEHPPAPTWPRCRPRRPATDGGWLLNGTKVWTSGAHLAHQIVVLAGPARWIRSTGTPASASSSCPPTPPGVTDQPIRLMNGEHHFNEVMFADVSCRTPTSSARSATAGTR